MLAGQSAMSQELLFTTVTREPFSIVQEGNNAGFSIDLLSEIAKDLRRPIMIDRKDGFKEMLDAVQAGEADGAIANISITAAREATMDFTLPIFSSGVQVMLHQDQSSSALFSALFTRDIAYALLLAFGVLFGCGILMWAFERARQEYFDRPFREAIFPSFWWALNLVVNGGFEERMPRSTGGRLIGVVMVVSSLFIVSVFVARITAAMTVEAIQSNVQSINELDGRSVGTIGGSTSAELLDARNISYTAFTDLNEMLGDFETKTLDAVVFDAPILAYYIQNRGSGKGRLMERIFKPENYGIALQAGSPLREDINRSILHLRENGVYDQLIAKWFGSAF
ncbi:MAG: transporter substrate-binding domain-containing protein [Sulfitobacter sp.]